MSAAFDPRWFPLARPVPGARCRLLCLPPAGGGASLYRDWPALLPAIEVLAAQLPGREHRVQEPVLRSFPQLVEALLLAVRSLPAGAPLALFGHSFGAQVGFAVTRQLCAEGLPPVLLAAAGARAPQLPPRRLLHDLPLPALLQEMLRLGGTSPRVLAEPELIALLEPCLRADLLVAESTVLSPSPALPVPLCVFGGREDHHVALADLQAWAAVAGAGLELELLPGGHFFVRDARRELLARLAAALPR